MKTYTVPAIAVALVLATVGPAAVPANAVPKAAKRSFQACSDMATQRGFSAQERGGGKKRFIAQCMSGKQQ
jgi:hypothetical protein